MTKTDDNHQDNPETTGTDDKDEKLDEFEGKTVDDLISMIKKDRRDAYKYRIRAKELQTQMDEFDTQEKKRREEKLKADGELQKLIDEKTKELDAIKPKVEAFEKLRTAEIETAKEKLKDDWLDEYENLSITALRKLTDRFAQKSAETKDVDNGKAKDPKKVQLNDAQRKEAWEKFPNMTREKAEEAWFDVLVKAGKIRV